MKIFHAAAKLDAGTDKKHDINFHWPYVICCDLHSQKCHTCCKLSILPACQLVKLVNFPSLSNLWISSSCNKSVNNSETTCRKPVDNKFWQPTCNKSVDNLRGPPHHHSALLSLDLPQPLPFLPLCLVKVCTGCPDCVSHTLTTQSSPPDTSLVQSGEKQHVFTSSSWPTRDRKLIGVNTNGEISPSSLSDSLSSWYSVSSPAIELSVRVSWDILLWDRPKFRRNFSNLKWTRNLQFGVFWSIIPQSGLWCSCSHFAKQKRKYFRFRTKENKKINYIKFATFLYCSCTNIFLPVCGLDSVHPHTLILILILT